MAVARKGRKPAEPAIADMVGKRHARIADAGREELDEHRGDGPVDHAHISHEHDQEDHDHRLVHGLEIGGCGVADGADIGDDAVDEGLVLRRELLGRHADAVEGGEFLVADLDLGDRAGGRGLVLVVHRIRRQHRLCDVAGSAEGRGAHGVELEGAFRRVGDDRDRRIGQRRLERRIGVMRQPLEDREVGQRREQAAREDDGLPADLVGQTAEDDEEERADDESDPDHVSWP